MSTTNAGYSQGRTAPAMLTKEQGHRYKWLIDGKIYYQNGAGLSNDWVLADAAVIPPVTPPLDEVLTAGNLSGANPIKMDDTQAVEFGSEDTKIVNVGADIHKHAETSVVHVGSESLLTAGFTVVGTATSCVGGVPVTTYRIWIQRSSPSSTVSNMYAMSGTVANPMIFPSAAQTAIPFGANISGVNPAFFPVANNCSLGFAEFDSWLTIGITDGDIGALGTIGIDFNSWGYADTGAPGGSGMSVTNGSVFWMTPDSGPTLSSDEQVVVAQITLPTATDWSIAFLGQGRSLAGGGDWNEYVTLTKSQGTSGGIKSKVTTDGKEMNITSEDTELPKSYMSPNGVSGVVDVNGLITRTLENSTTATTYSQVDTGGSTLGSLTLQYGPSSDNDDKILTLPNTVSGTIALTSDIIDPSGLYLPLAGGTLTGNLNSVDVIPVLANTHDLGTAALFYKQAYISGIDAGSNRSLVLTTDTFDIRLDSAANIKLQPDGNISLEPQLAGSQIQFLKDHGTIGDHWVSTGINGEGHWETVDVIQTAEVTLTSNDILNLTTQPIELLPEIEGYAYFVENMIVEHQFGTAAYDYGGGINSKMGIRSAGSSNAPHLQTNVLSSTASKTEKAGLSNDGELELISGAVIEMFKTGVNYTLGDGDAVVTLYYRMKLM